jgi:Na+/H+ antiporter NhaD/arsenite permease-like protein
VANPDRRNFYLLWLFVAILWLAAAAVSYFRSGEVNMIALVFAIISIAISIISRSKNRGPDS